MKPKAYSYIRFSSPDQLKGDSLRRQLEASRKYAQSYNLDLDESMQDLGISSFRGKNRTKGNLGDFLKLIEKGKIPAGSVLIVENLDRLSREQPLIALSQFIGIIQAGIKLVTLQNNQEYTQENLNEGQLYLTVGEIIRANRESERKSFLIGTAWANKRNEAINGGKKLTAKCPLWLKLSEDKKKFIILDGPTTSVKEIFYLMKDGKGMGFIEREMNKRPDLWSPKSGWRKSYIHKILNNRAVLGEFTPHRLTEKGRVPELPIKDYYPRIISDELFYNVQDQIQSKGEGKESGYSGGQTGKANNLFVHRVKCGLCKSPMHLIDKGKLPKGGKYLRCDVGRRRKTCSSTPVRYDEFEKLFFANFEELNVLDLMPEKEDIVNQTNDLKSIHSANLQHIKDLIEVQGNFTNAIGNTKDQRVSRVLDNKLIETLDEIDKLVQSNHNIEGKLKDIENDEENLKANIDTVKEVYDLFKACKDESAQISLRLKLQTYIRKIVKSIEIYPLQEGYKPIEEVEPGVYKTMHSKYIDHVRIRFNGNNNSRTLWLKRGFDISDVEAV